MSAASYAHMCRDGHEEIGHNDSEHEMCPLCRAINALDDAETQIVIAATTDDPNESLRRLSIASVGIRAAIMGVRGRP